MINKSIPFCKFAPENASGMAREWSGIASALPRKLFTLLFCFLFIGVGNAWADWTLCTSASDFAANNYYMFVSDANSTHYYLKAPSTNKSAGSWSSSTDTCTACSSDPTTLSLKEAGWKLVAGASSGQWKLTSNRNSSTYLYATNNNNGLASAASGTASSYWTITKHSTNNTFKFTYYSQGRSISPYTGASPYGLRSYTSAQYVKVYKWNSCTPINPSVSYSSTTIYKGDVTSAPTITGNTGSATITWTSSDPTVATVNSSGVVTALKAGTTTIKAAFAATGDYCSKEVSTTFTVRYRVKWSVNGNDSYTTGSPTTYISTHNTKVSTLPTDPTSAMCDNTKVFVGWTTSSYSHATNAPTTLFLTAASSPNVTDNVTYYAVFANRTDFTRVTSTSQLAAGKQIVVVDDQNSKVLTTAPGYATAPTESSSKITPSNNMIWTLEANSTNWKLKTSGSYLGASSTSNGTSVSLTSTNSIWTIGASSSGTNNFYLLNTGGTNLCLEYYSSGSSWVVYANKNYTSSTYFTEKLYVATLTNYATTCCTELGSINGSVSWSNGTSATLTWDDLSNVSAYAVTWKTGSGSYSSTGVGSITGTGTKTCSISGLTAGNSYDFKIAVSAASGYCDKDSTMTSKAPKITATTDANLVDATYAEGSGPSTNASYFTFSGVGLTGDITVTAPTNFQVSKTSSSSGFGSSVTVSPSTGSITNQKIWIRLVSDLTNASSPYGGNVTLSGGSAASVNVAITGSVTSACSAPTVATPTLASIASGTITPSCASVTVDENCDVTDYGFVWKASSDPTIDDNKTSLGDETPASAFSSDLSISFTTGNTYKIKAYAINSAGTTLSSSLTVTPQKVTFNSNGGSDVADKYVNKDTKVTAPSDPTKTGYTFGGWYREAGCTNAWTFGTDEVSQDTTLYAKWNPASYDVTLKANGGTSADQVVSATYTQAMPSTVKAGTDIVAPTYNGYTFGGYYDNADYSLGTQYYTNTLASAHNWDKTSDANLYGRWTANNYTVTLDANGGEDGATTSVETTFGQAMPTIATANLPTREGYRFDGFWTHQTSGTQYYNANGTSAKNQARYSANQTLYAHWKALTYFSVNGDIVPGLTIDDGAEMPSATVPTTCGDCWAFLGWSEDSEESSAIDYASGDTHTFGTPTTLYAVYGQTEYKMITSTDGLVANDNYVIASSSGLALSNADHSYYSTDAASSDISSISRVNAGSISVYNPTSNIIWKFTGTYSSGQLYNTAASKYVNLDAAKVLDASSQNLTFSVNDDGETWTIKSSTPKYLHGYVDGNGDGFESLTSSSWDEDEDFSAYILHQTSSTVTTTPNCLTYDIVWKVGNDEASGTPTDNTTTCTGIEELPDDPDDNALDCATKFMGWSESILTGEGKSAPTDLFTTASGAPKIDEDKTFHAVFASVDTENETPTYLTSEFTSYSWADENSLWTSGAAGGGYANSGVQIQGSTTAYATTKASYYKVDSVEVTYYTNKTGGKCGIKISVGSTKIDSLTAQYSSGDGRYVAQTLKFKSASLPLTGTVQIYAKGNTSSIYIASVKIYYRENAYKDYMTICCNKSITIGTPSITGSGTVTFTLGGEDLDPGDDVETCTSAKDVVATVTPAAGYSCTSLTFSGGSVSVDPTPGAGNYPAAPSTQDYTLSFAKETTSATLSTSATFTAKALSSWTWTYNSAAIPNPVNLYEGEKARFDVEYTPSDIIDGKKTYTRTKEDAYMNWYGGGIQPTYFQCQGKASTGESTTPIVVTHADGPTITINVKVKPLPSVTFVDNVHNKTDFTNWGTDGVVSSTVTTGVVTHTKPTPSHADISDPGSNYNTCERQHLHLVGWIRSDWADEHPSATHSQITSVGDDDAGNPYFYTAGADIDIEAQNGKTFYAVWSKIE